ncbi:MAG: HAMP domain-containing protein [Saprospiraceae bacterium]|nr:HAMP domain-containing protein [Saprospiraceae bacterium]
MAFNDKSNNEKSKIKSFFIKYLKYQSSIYGQVVYIITILSVILFVSFGFIFRSVNEEYLNSVIHQCGNNIGSIVEGALYQHMLDIINTMPSIKDVNMYDAEDNLVYSSLPNDSILHDNPNCKECHVNIKNMFPQKEKSFKIVNIDNECQMCENDRESRFLLIKSPILNEKSCYTADCHAHPKSEEVLGSFVIRLPLKELDNVVKESSTDFFLLAALTTILLVVFLIIFTRRNIKHPLNNLIKASIAVSKGDKSTRLEIKPYQLNDMKMVSTAFNEMLDNIQSVTKELQNWSQQLEYKVQKKSEELMEMQHELIRVERIASLGKLSSSVAHEINNPLSGILTYTKLVNKQLSKLDLDNTTKESMLKYLRVIEDETKRCGDIVKGLLDFSRKDQQNFESQNMHKILEEAYALMGHQMKIADISFIKDFSATSDLIFCSKNQIKQACVAILLNSSEAVTDNAEIIMRTSNPDDNTIKLEIEDNGVGIAQDDIQHIFEPFFSAKQKVSGIGLGLAIVHGIVQSHNGKIEVDSELGKRTTISIILPLIKKPKEIK